MLAGLAMAHPQIALLDGQQVALRADVEAIKARGEVALVSGGGAGHEPAHAGYIGPGMLTAAVVGDVFSSPSTDAVLAAIHAVAGPVGVLLIVKNYTGDRLNFGLAAEIARAEGWAVEMVVVADDVALAAQGDHAGRRGLAGAVLVHKIAGAVAAAGGTLAQVRAAAADAAAAIGTMGVALTPCTVPAAGRPGFELAADEVELGLGIHGEAGVRRSAIEPADAIVAQLLGAIVADLALVAGDRVALLVNNLGGTPAMEIAIVARAATHVRPGGTLVYAVCSVLHQEAEAVVALLLAGDSSLVPAPIDAPELAHLNEGASQLRLLPHLHGTDGYFIACFRKRSL